MAFYCPECKEKFDPEERTKETVPCPHCGHDCRIPDEYRSDVLNPGTRIGGFEVVRLIGSGGMGKVYEATQLSLNRSVALKTLSRRMSASERQEQRFLVEVRATASLQHPNIVTIYEADIKDDFLFLAMALIEGESIDKMLEATNTPIPEAEALDYALQIAEAMDYAWRHQKLLHRDIKPANILVTKDGVAKLCDLGIAKRPAEEIDLSQAGMAVGTPHYMSPEQGQGLVDLDFRTDIYSLGASLYHMLTATLPYDSAEAVNVITKHIIEPLPSPKERNPDISSQAVQLIELMMAKLPEQRHGSWKELIADMDRVATGKYPVFRPTEASETAEDTPSHESMSDTQYVPIVSPRQKPSFMVVYAAAGVFFIVLICSLVVYLAQAARYRALKMPDVLVQDDGTPPLPQALPRPRKIRLSTATWSDPLDRLPELGPDTEPPPEDRFRYVLRDARREGLSPIIYAQQLRRQNAAEAEKVLWYCVKEYHGPSGAWAAQAGRMLAKTFHAQARREDWIEVQRQRMTFAEIGQPSSTAEAYSVLATYLARDKRPEEAEKTIRDGLRKYSTTYPGVADVLTADLLTFLDGQKRHKELRALILDVKKRAPVNSRAFWLATELSKRLKPETPVKPPVKEDPKAAKLKAAETEVKPYRGLLARKQKDEDKVDILLQIAAVYRKHNLPDKNVAALQQIADQYGSLDKGSVGGKVLHLIAAQQKAAGREDLWVRALIQLTDRKLGGPDGSLCLKAAWDLANYYATRRNETMRNKYLTMIMAEYPGKEGDNAGQAALRLARYKENEKRLFTARTILDRVVKEFPGIGARHKKRAQDELKRLDKKSPIALPKKPKPKIDTGPFERVITFNSLNEEHIEFLSVNRTLARARSITVECWFRQHKITRGSQVLISQHGDNQRGFLLLVDGGRVTFKYGDGQRDYAIDSAKIDVQKWHHVAAVMDGDKAQLFIDGKQVDSRTGKTLQNEGGGRIRIGLHAKNRLTFLDGSIQNIMIFPKPLYKANFKPSTKIHDLKEAAVAVVATKGGITDLRKNKIRVH